MSIKQNFRTIAELETDLGKEEEVQKRILRRLHGPPVQCTFPKCNFAHSNPDEFRLRTVNKEGEIKHFIFCRLCASVLLEKRGMQTAPYGDVLRGELEESRHMVKEINKLLEKRREVETQRSARVAQLAEVEEDFFIELGIPTPSPSQEPAPIVEMMTVEKPAKRPTNAQKKRERMAAQNGAAPAEPTPTEEERVTH